MSARAKALKAQGIAVIDLGVGEPDMDTPPHVKQAAIRAIEQGFTKYTPPAGTDELKQAVADRIRRELGLTYEVSEILISCGAKHTLYNIAQALFDPGDEVIIPAPYWVSYPDQVLLQDAVPVIVPTREVEPKASNKEEGFLLTPQAFEAAITSRTKALILNSPSNPTGAAYPRERLERLAEIARRRNVVVISDEIYDAIRYDGGRHVSIATVHPGMRDLTVIVNGVSKTFSMTGWRIGYAAGPKPLIQAMSDVQSQSTSNPTSISQKAAVAALRGESDFTQRMVAEFDQRRRFLVERLNQIPDVSCPMPAGAFYVFPRVEGYLGRTLGGREIKNSSDLAIYLLEEAHVATVAGEAFGADGHLRISYAVAMDQLKIATDRIATALERLRKGR